MRTFRRLAPLVLLVSACDHPAAPDAAAALANCRRDAQASVDAFARRDVDTMVRYLHPAALDASSATPEALKAKVRKSLAEIDGGRTKFDPPTLAGPAKVFAGGKLHFAIVDEAVTIRNDVMTIAAKSYLLGVSDDAGRSWRFVDGAGLKKMDVAKVLPEYPLATRPLPTMPKPEVKFAAAR